MGIRGLCHYIEDFLNTQSCDLLLYALFVKANLLSPFHEIVKHPLGFCNYLELVET